MADSRGFKPINQLWSAAVSGDPDSECLYEEISGLSSSREGVPGGELRGAGVAAATIVVAGEGTLDRARKKRKVGHDHHQQQQQQQQQQQEEVLVRCLDGDDYETTRLGTRVEEHRYAPRSYYGEPGTGGQIEAAATFKLTRNRSEAARYLQSAAAAAAHYHQHQPQRYYQHHHVGSLRRPGARPRHHQFARGPFSDETQEEIQEDDEATLREMLVR